MAGIEKMCELTGEDCGWRMYNWKRDSIQISKSVKSTFRKVPAVLFRFRSETYREIYKTGFTSSVDIKYLDIQGYNYINGRWYSWQPLSKGWEKLKPCNLRKEYFFILYVPNLPGEVNSRYVNWTTNWQTTVRRIGRLLCYKPKIINLDMTEREWYDIPHDKRKEILNAYF